VDSSQLVQPNWNLYFICWIFCGQTF